MNAMFPAVIYLLCAVTSAVCAWLLLRSWRQTGTRLLLWSALCFVGLMLNSALVVFDVLVFPNFNLVPLRQAASLSAVAILLFGFVWDVE